MNSVPSSCSGLAEVLLSRAVEERMPFVAEQLLKARSSRPPDVAMSAMS